MFLIPFSRVVEEVPLPGGLTSSRIGDFTIMTLPEQLQCEYICSSGDINDFSI